MWHLLGDVVLHASANRAPLNPTFLVKALCNALLDVVFDQLGQRGHRRRQVGRVDSEALLVCRDEPGTPLPKELPAVGEAEMLETHRELDAIAPLLVEDPVRRTARVRGRPPQLSPQLAE